MPAHAQRLQTRCDKPGCSSRPSYQLFDTWNGPRGQMCKRHADQWVREWNASFAKHPHDGRVQPKLDSEDD